MHFFIDHSKLPVQPISEKYGPEPASETTRYWATSVFQLSEEAKAFACLPGQMIVQQSVADASLVNVILEPDNIPEKPHKIKYIIYRGILKSSLISGTELLPKSTTDKNELITRIYNAIPSITTYNAVILGYDNNTLNGTDNVDTIFYKGSGTVKPIKVLEGEWFGNFTTSRSIGLEVIMDTDKINVDLDFVRSARTVIDVTGLSGFDERIEREQILSFIDPAALWGLYYNDGIRISEYNAGVKTTIKKKHQDIYDLLIAPYATKNRVYLDIRSEYGYSYNLYQNYADQNGLNIKIGNNDITPVPQYYSTYGWPIIFVDNALETSLSWNYVRINLRVDDNLKPILFYEDLSIVDSPDDSFFLDEQMLLVDESDTEWTRGITISFPNTGTNPEKDNVANYLKMTYFRQINNPNSPDTVLQKMEDGDNIFCPLNKRGLGDDDNPFEQIENEQPVFVNGTLEPEPVYPGSIEDLLPPSNDFSYFSKSGAYFNSEAVTFYTNFDLPKKQSRNPLSRTPLKNFGLNIAGKFANQSYLAKDTLVGTTMIEEELPGGGSQKIDILSIRAAQNFARQKENINFLGITKAELQALKAAPGLSGKHAKFITFVKEQPTYVDLNGIVYKKATLAVQGLDDNGKQKIIFPQENISIYSEEGFGQVVSKLYSQGLKYLIQEPIIENEISYEKLPLTDSLEFFRIIGESEARGNTEDLESNFDDGPLTPGIDPEVQGYSDTKLFLFLNILFTWATKLDKGLEWSAADFTQKFKYNNSTANKFSNNTINERVATNSRFINYIKGFGKDLEDRLKNVNGNIDLVNPIFYPKEKPIPQIGNHQKRPTFNQEYDLLHGLTILLNDTESTEIRLENYQKNPLTFEWNAILRVEILDHFGVDYADITGDRESRQKYLLGVGKGFSAWWVLQHRKGYKPFITKVNVRCKISGNYQ